jgi:hypothetical protein
MDGDAQRLFLLDEHNEFLASCYSRVDQVPLQQHVVLRGERDHHRSEFRSLRLVDRDRIRRGNLVQFAKIVLHHPVIDANPYLMLDRIYLLDDSDVPVEHVLVIIILRLDDFVPYLESPSEPFHRRFSRLRWIQRPLQR